MRNNTVKYTALCGVFAGVAVTIMCLGGLIPFSTYITPMLCIVIAQIILVGCGRRYALTWYVVVSILGIMLCPDKEAALLFLFLGSYPCLKQFFDRTKLRIIWKLLYFNAIIVMLYFVLCTILGLNEISSEYAALGTTGLAVLLILGNITFFLLDHILSFRIRKRA